MKQQFGLSSSRKSLNQDSFLVLFCIDKACLVAIKKDYFLLNFIKNIIRNICFYFLHIIYTSSQERYQKVNVSLGLTLYNRVLGNECIEIRNSIRRIIFRNKIFFPLSGSSDNVFVSVFICNCGKILKEIFTKFFKRIS